MRGSDGKEDRREGTLMDAIEDSPRCHGSPTGVIGVHAKIPWVHVRGKRWMRGRNERERRDG
jgi:hypothetical protein